MNEMTVDVAIIGAGTAGLYALREVRRARKSFVLIDHGPLGTTCARVGCMPSKIALHTAEIWKESKRFPGMLNQQPDTLSAQHAEAWVKLRAQRDRFAGGAANKATSAAKDNLLMGRAKFLAQNQLEVDEGNQRTLVNADAIVVATGSSPVMPDWAIPLGNRAINTDQLFELESLPKSIAVFGLGAVGLEMGLALSRLGIKVIGIGRNTSLAGISDPEIAQAARDYFGNEMELWLGEKAQAIPLENGVEISSAGKKAIVESVLVATGRRPNLGSLNLTAAGITLDEKGLPNVDMATMQTDSPTIFFAGDATGKKALMHEAADEGAIAGYNAVRSTDTRFRRKTPLAIVFSRPDIATVGTSFDLLDPATTITGTAYANTDPRSRVIHGDGGLLRIYANAETGRLLGASILAIDGEHLAHLLAWAIQRGETIEQLMQMPFYHPAVEELLHSALQSAARKLPTRSALPSGLVLE